MKKKRLAILLALIFVFSAAACGNPGHGQSDASADADFAAYVQCVDAGYSYGLMKTLTGFQTNEDLGFRTAGSAAELAAADFIESEMKNIGLENVQKEPITVDTFTFTNADLTYQAQDGEKTIEMAMFQTTCQAENEEVEIVYLGQGTASDYEDMDVQGKIVLLDINQLDNWWINWPAYQAKVKGARAIIAVNTEGYCTYSDDTVGVQDFCGPSDAPAFTISVKDANPLKKAIADNGGSVKAILNADGVVEHDGTAYNVYGEIPGKTDEVIYMFAHYDAYFHAFADNTSGIACILGIAKALKESGYQPQRTIKFIGHGAEEWGVDNSRYDWARGATVEMENHPDWMENAFVAFDMDSGVVSGDAQGVEITVPYELADWSKTFADQIPGSTYPEAVQTNSPAWTWTEAFCYVNAGIPVIDSGQYGTDHTSTYHSNNDSEEGNSYSEDTFRFSHEFYGGMVILLDKQTSRVFDYADLFDAMSETVNPEVIENAPELLEALDRASAASEAYKEKCENVRKKAAAKFNTASNKLFKDVTNQLFTLDWNEEFQFAHCYKQTNVEALEKTIAYLKQGDVKTAVDEELYKVDMGWYAYAFDEETFDFFVDQVLGPDAKNSWGTGYVKSHADIWQVIQDLNAMYDEESPDASAQIAVLEKELETQKADLNAVVTAEIQALNNITETMTSLSK